MNKSGSAAAVAVSNVNIRAGDNTAYASVYSTGGWYGDLLAFSVDVTTGNVTTNTPIWSARDLLEAHAPSARVIATYNSSDACRRSRSAGPRCPATHADSAVYHRLSADA